MLMENKFGKISRITACAALKNGKTILEDLSFTAPYKIMAPFEKENGGIQIMPLCASAGIMEGDSQEFSYHVKEGADLEVLSQSFEKIHKMDEGSASRTISVQVDPHAVLYYYPQPVIPFAQSSFTSTMTIHLADETSRLFLLEIISCGRNAHEERFQYRRFASKVQIFRGQKLIYRDNTCYLPIRCRWKGLVCTRDTRIWRTFFSQGQNTRIRFSMKSGKFLTAIRKSTAAQRRSPAAILLFGFSDTVRRSCSRRRKKSKLCMKNFYKNRLENF